MTVKTYDRKSYGLAQHFMQDCPQGTTTEQKKADTHELALAIQEAVEDWFKNQYSYDDDLMGLDCPSQGGKSYWRSRKSYSPEQRNP